MRIAWIIVAIVVVLGGGYVVYVNVAPDSMRQDNTMMIKDDAMMQNNGMEKDDDGTMMKVDGDAMMKVDSDAMMKNDDMIVKNEQAMMVKGSYMAYAPEVLTNGETKVLFFHAPWCPSCKKGDSSLTAWYAAGDYARSVYKVDYDTSNDLKAKYGVTYQHTFVLVDGEGNALKTLLGPTDAQLQALLQA